MKRYESYYGDLMDDPNGDWVRYEDATAFANAAVAAERERHAVLLSSHLRRMGRALSSPLPGGLENHAHHLTERMRYVVKRMELEIAASQPPATDKERA